MKFKYNYLIEEFSYCSEISKMLLEAKEAGLIDEDTDELKQGFIDLALKFTPLIDYLSKK